MSHSGQKNPPSQSREVPTVSAVTSGTVSFARPSPEEPRFTQDTIVTKRVFTLSELELECGRRIKNVQIGYECYGKLTESGDNAILILHYFTGSSHAAGRYNADDPEPGYWDAIIGPGKAIDTDKYFVVAVDCLSNLYSRNPMVITTGPASINPDTNKPYGADFPIVTMGDFVNSQYALCQYLGIPKLHAVCGISMGSMTALEWAARFPNYVQRVLGVIGGDIANGPYLISLLRQWTAPIFLDEKFNDGNYLPEDPPLDGLAAALELVTLTSLSPQWANRVFQRRPADRDAQPSERLENRFAIESAIERTAKARATLADANSFLRLAKAVQLFDITPIVDRITAKIFWISARHDKLLLPEYAAHGVKTLRDLGINVQTDVIETDGGHLDGLNEIRSKSEEIKKFISSSIET